MKNTNGFATFRNAYIVAGTLFVLLFALSMILFGFVTVAASGIIMNLIQAFAVISALIVAALAAMRCAASNKAKNPDIFIPKRDTFYYLKRIGFITLMMFLMSVASSMVGFFTSFVFGTIALRVENEFLSNFILTLPVFALYLILMYKMLIRFGFMDCQKKIFNPHLINTAIIAAILIFAPGAVQGNFFYSSALDAQFPSVHLILSPGVGTYTFELGYGYSPNPDFSALHAVLIAVTVLVTFAIQFAFFRFAYARGKKIFIKQHIREVDEYAMDENI